MINETQLLKDAIEYLQNGLQDMNVLVLPKNQRNSPSDFRMPRIPCVALTVSSQVAQESITQEILATAQIHATVFAKNIYAPTDSADGIHTIFDRVNELMTDRYWRRSNQTEPYFNVANNCWNKDGYFTKKTNQF